MRFPTHLLSSGIGIVGSRSSQEQRSITARVSLSRRSILLCELAALAVLTAAAFALRIWQLDSLPPGLHFDEAAYGLLTNDVRAGHLRIFFREFTGREPVYIYLVASTQLFFGPTIFAERLPAAICGAATIPATFWALREVFHGEGEARARRIAWLGALAVAVSFWGLHASRQGERANLVPLCAALASAATWRSTRVRTRPWLIAAGVLSSLALYTYPSARSLPVLAATFGGYGWLRWWLGVRGMRPASRRRSWRALVEEWRDPALLWAGAAILTAAPLGLYFLIHPADFVQRTGQVSVLSGGGPQLARNVRDALGMLVVKGSGDLKYTLPGRPVFDLLAAPFFVVGVMVCASAALRRAAYAFLLCWWGALALPAVLSIQGNHPLRALGILPALAGIWAVGGDAAWDALAGRWRMGRVVGAVLLGAVLCTSFAWTCRDYFDRWAGEPKLYGAMDGEYADLAAYLNTLPDDGTARVIAAEELRYSTIVYLAPRSARYGWVDPSQALVVPASVRRGGRLEYIVPDRVIGVRGVPADWYAALGVEPEIGLIHAPDGHVLGKVYRFQIPAGGLALAGDMVTACAEGATFGGDLTLLGWRVGEQPHAGGDLPLTLYWEAQRPSVAQWQIFVHLVATPDAPERLAQRDANGAFTRGLGAGDLVIGRYALPLVAVPAGDYALQIGLYDLDDPRELRASLSGQGCATTERGDSLVIAPFKVLP